MRSVENLFRDLIKAGVDRRGSARRTQPPDAAWQDVDKDDYAAFIATNDGCVIGGTAWDFANDTRITRGSLDLLVIEEAGQFCSRQHHRGGPRGPQPDAARRPATAASGQPGTSPRAGRRVRARLARRRPPHACPTSSATSSTARTGCTRGVRAGVAAVLRGPAAFATRAAPPRARSTAYPPGVRVLTVDHDGNSTSSPRRPRRSSRRSQRLLGSPWTDEDGTRPLGQDDVLVVAPYNAQVLLLRDAFRTPRGCPMSPSAPSTSSRAGRHRWCSCR
mgnify:CR=1 FL=1